MPSVSDSFVAHVDTPFMQQIFNVPEPEREANVQHQGKTNDLRLVLKYLNGYLLVMAERQFSALFVSSCFSLTVPWRQNAKIAFKQINLTVPLPVLLNEAGLSGEPLETLVT